MHQISMELNGEIHEENKRRMWPREIVHASWSNDLEAIGKRKKKKMRNNDQITRIMEKQATNPRVTSFSVKHTTRYSGVSEREHYIFRSYSYTTTERN